MSLETNKTHLEAGSFKALKNVADVARQVMLGEEQEKLEIQELVNIISAARYLDENQKNAIIEIFGLSAKEKTAKADKQKAGVQGEKDKKERESASAAKEKEAAAKKKEAEDANKKKDLERAREKASRETDAYRGIEKIDKKMR